MDLAWIRAETTQHPNSKSNIRMSGKHGIHESANETLVGVLLHSHNLFRLSRTVILGQLDTRRERSIMTLGVGNMIARERLNDVPGLREPKESGFKIIVDLNS